MCREAIILFNYCQHHASELQKCPKKLAADRKREKSFWRRLFTSPKPCKDLQPSVSYHRMDFCRPCKVCNARANTLRHSKAVKRNTHQPSKVKSPQTDRLQAQRKAAEPRRHAAPATQPQHNHRRNRNATRPKPTTQPPGAQPATAALDAFDPSLVPAPLRLSRPQQAKPASNPRTAPSKHAATKQPVGSRPRRKALTCDAAARVRDQTILPRHVVESNTIDNIGQEIDYMLYQQNTTMVMNEEDVHPVFRQNFQGNSGRPQKYQGGRRRR
jgi:hypothetical protein